MYGEIKLIQISVNIVSETQILHDQDYYFFFVMCLLLRYVPSGKKNLMKMSELSKASLVCTQTEELN